jgi:hypothetical protein
LSLTDTPDTSYDTHALKFVRVNSTPDELEFVALDDSMVATSETHTDILSGNSTVAQALHTLDSLDDAHIPLRPAPSGNLAGGTTIADVSMWVDEMADDYIPLIGTYSGLLAGATTVADAMDVLDALDAGVPASATDGSTLYYSSGWVESNIIFNDHANAEVGINTQTPNATLHVNGSLSAKIVTVTANYDMTSGTNSDLYTLLCNNTAGAITVTLPAVASSAGRVYHIKKISGASNDVVIDGSSSETIDGEATSTLDTQYEAVTVVCDGTAWYIV